MKKAAFLWLICIFCIQNMHSQNSAQVLDSIVEYSISGEQDSILVTKSEYQYNTNGIQISYRLFQWYNDYSKWYLVKSQQKVFNENGKQIEQVEHEIYNTGVLGYPYVKHEWEYDSNGNQLHVYKYHKYEDYGDWNPNTKQDFKTNNSGQTIQRLVFSWGEDIHDWKPNSLYTYSYNSLELEVEQLLDSWGKDSHRWEKSRKFETTYTPGGVKLSEYSYFWRSDLQDWENLTDFWTEYDSLGRLSKQKTTNVGASHLTEYYYDSLGNYTMYYSSSPPWLGVFNPTIKFIRTVNSNQEWIKEEKYNSVDGRWVPYNKAERYYNEFGNISHVTSYGWNEQISQWKLNGRTFYYYQNQSTGVNNFEIDNIIVYPNPTNGLIHLSGLNHSATIQLWNHNGQLLYTFYQNNGSIDISGFPSGFYFIHIRQTVGAINKFAIIKY